MTKFAAIQDALTAASIEIDGQRWVRAGRAATIMGLSSSWYRYQAKWWNLTILRRPVKTAPCGVEVYIMLDSLLRMHRDRKRLRRYRPWSEKDDARLIEMIRTQPIAAIASALGRSRRGVLCRLGRMGNARALLRDRHHLITSGQLMKLLRKSSYGTLRRWRQKGLHCHRAGFGRQDTLFDLHDVRSFLHGHPELMILLHPAARKLLRLTTAELERRAA